MQLQNTVSPPNKAKKLAKQRLSCQAALLKNCEAVLPQAAALKQIESALGPLETRPGARPMAKKWGATININTTTLTLKLYHQPTNLYLKEATALNPQTTITTNIINHINTTLKNQKPQLQQQITQTLNQLLKKTYNQTKIQPQKIKT